jgi:hypothetical protein
MAFYFQEDCNMAVAAVERCKRCGTKMRNNRKVCACCAYDPSEPVATAEEAQPGHIRKVAAKAGVKMCAICMSSVPVDQMVEQDGQKICPDCAENMKNKAMKKAAGPPPG